MKELIKISKGLEEIARAIEDKISWGDGDFSDVISDINSYAEDLKTIDKTIPELNDLKSIDEYESKAQAIIENQIKQLLEDNN